MAKYKPTSKDELLGDIESEIDAFKKEVEEQDKEKDEGGGRLPFKVPVLTKSSDKYGHKAQIRFSVPQWMVGYANSLMTIYPQARTPTDMQRACFYAGIRLLDYIGKEGVDKDVAFYSTVAKQFEWEMVDLERISHVGEMITFLRSKSQEGVISIKEYIKRKDELFGTLKKVLVTQIGKGAYEKFTNEIKERDNNVNFNDTSKRFKW